MKTLKTIGEYIRDIAAINADEERKTASIIGETLNETIEAALWDLVATYVGNEDFKKLLDEEYTKKSLLT